MQTPEPLTIERLYELYELCEQVKTSPPGTIEVWRDDLWALVDMAKQLHEYKRAEEDKRFEARTADTEA